MESTVDLFDGWIQNKTKFVIHKINYLNGKSGYDKNYITKVFLSIWSNGFETVCIDSKLDSPEELVGYDYYNDYYTLSNGSKIILNSNLAEDFVCWIVSDDDLKQTDFNYFIMELNLFEAKYKKFKFKLSNLISQGYDVKTIQYFFDEFTKEPEIDIL